MKTQSLLKINFNKVNPTSAIVNYINKRVEKRKYKQVVNEVDWVIAKDSKKGNSKYRITMEVVAGKTRMFFREVGNDIYKLIDAIIDKFNRKFGELNKVHTRKLHQKLKEERAYV